MIPKTTAEKVAIEISDELEIETTSDNKEFGATVKMSPVVVNTEEYHIEGEILTNSSIGTNTTSSSSTAKFKCPWHKILPDIRFAVDAFGYGKIDNIDAYFLSHFHSDHYTKLSKKWDSGLIFGSRATLRLVQMELRVDEKFLIPLEMGLNIVNGIRVTLIDANHCPGAVLFLFESPNGQKILHCGDFRACADHWTNPLLLQQPIDIVYLDTTYCDPSHCFPAQMTVLELISELSRKVDSGASPQSILNENTLQSFFKILNPVQSVVKTLFVVGTYLIGKEKVFLTVANAVNGKVYTNARKRRIYDALQDPQLSKVLTDDPYKAKIHVVPMGDISNAYLETLLQKYPQFDRILAFRPTGWTFKPKSNSQPFKLSSLKPNYPSLKIAIIPIPYSEHSSFLELEEFVKKLSFKRIIPTVNLSSRRIKDMKRIFSDWQRSK